MPERKGRVKELLLYNHNYNNNNTWHAVPSLLALLVLAT